MPFIKRKDVPLVYMIGTFHPNKIVKLQPVAGITACIYPVAKITDEAEAAQHISARDKVRLRNISHEQKRKEFLASRLALCHLDPNYCIVYEGRIPNLDNGNFVSLTHAHHVAAAVLSKNFVVGIDVEMQREQLFKISDKFLHPEEKAQVRKAQELHDLHVYWGAKEAMYKIYKKGKVDFSHELRVDPFGVGPNGETTGRIVKDGKTIGCTIHFQTVKNYHLVIAWTNKY